MPESELSLQEAYNNMQAARAAATDKADIVWLISEELSIRPESRAARLIEIAEEKNRELEELRSVAKASTDQFTQLVHSKPGTYPIRSVTHLWISDPDRRNNNPGKLVVSFAMPDGEGGEVPVEKVARHFRIHRTPTEVPLIEILPDALSPITLQMPIDQMALPVDVREYTDPNVKHEPKKLVLPKSGDYNLTPGT